VTALTKREPGTADQPATSSRGCHALTRTLPLAALLRPDDPNFTTELAADVAARTHGHPDAQVDSLMAVHVAGFALLTGSVTQAARTLFVGVNLRGGSNLWERAEDAHDDAIRQPRDTAPSRASHRQPLPMRLPGGLYAALSYPELGDAMDALRFAAAAPDGDSVAAVTGALVGATHGVEVWPTDLLSRLELT
jgi:ADP-ribosylglycohydrolase